MLYSYGCTKIKTDSKVQNEKYAMVAIQGENSDILKVFVGI